MGVLQNIKTTYKYNGVSGVFRKIKYKITNGYNHFLRCEERPTWQEMENQCQEFEYEPVLSAIIPVYKPDLWQLVQCVDSVLAQPYRKVEVVLSLDGDAQSEIEDYIQKVEQKDQRLIIVRNDLNQGISNASNRALQKATGDYVMLIDQDDMLAPHAVVEIVQVLQERQYDFIYTDEDMIDERNKRFSPQFKPDWSPHTLLSRMYVNHLSVYRKEVVQKVGGFRSEYDGSQDYDLLLRASKYFQSVKHISKVLYHWRTSKDSIATDISNKGYIFEKAQKALQDYFQSAGHDVRIAPHGDLLMYDFDIKPQSNELVSILIPFKDGVDLTIKLLNSIQRYAGYEEMEIILINNQSSKHTLETLETYIQNSPLSITICNADYTFNYSKMNNDASQMAKGEYLLFLNNDIEWFEENTLQKLVGVGQLEKAGAVGCKLLYPNDTIQHAGVIMGYHEVAGHFSVGQPKDAIGYYGRNISLFNASAVTAACLLVKKEYFEQCGGFDETLSVAYQDVDFCLKLLESGKYNIHVGNVQMYHHESITRGFDDVTSIRYQKECEIMQNRYAKIIANDPYYNSNLSIKVGELFQIKRK